MSLWLFDRETTCYVQTELFLIPMAAYERALLLIIQHTQRASHDASRASDFDLLLEVPMLQKCYELGPSSYLQNICESNRCIFFRRLPKMNQIDWAECGLQAKKELALAEGFKQDFNFLWRLLGRVHAARGAIQNLMGEEVRELLHLFIYSFMCTFIFHFPSSSQQIDLMVLSWIIEWIFSYGHGKVVNGNLQFLQHGVNGRVTSILELCIWDNQVLVWSVQRSTTVEANGEEWKDSEENVEGAPSSDIFFDAL